MPGRRTVRRLPALVAMGMLAGCATLPPFDDLPGGGTDATTGQIVIDDIWIDGPHGLAAGADAPLRLTLTNESTTTDDALVGVSTPVAERATFRHDGQAVADIAVPAASQTDLEWSTGVELEDLRRAVSPGQWFMVTLRFAHAAPVTQLVTVGPLPASPTPAISATSAQPTGRTR
jgi:hypothetical protein